MPTPTKPITAAAKSSSLGAGDYVTFTNHTRAGRRIVRCSDKGEAVLQDPPSTWENGDVISAETHGRFAKGVSQTAITGGVRIQFGTLSADNMPQVNL